MFRETVTNTKKEQKIDAIVQILRTIQSSELVSNNSIIYDEFSGIIQRLKEKSFRVVVAGEFSSGKSTFLNAIIGRDLLKHGVQETTATVTEIYNEISCTDTPVLDVYFSDGTVQKGIQASQIMEVTATSSSTHAVAQEIDKVVIRYKILDHAADVCFMLDNTIHIGCTLKSVRDELERCGVRCRTKRQHREFEVLLKNLIDHSRMIIYRGFTPAEAARLQPDREV